MTKANQLNKFFNIAKTEDLELLPYMVIGVINYELIWRRPAFYSLRDFTLLLDESSLIQNEKAKRTKFIIDIAPENVIMLSGTVVNGNYEKLYSQCKLLGMNTSKAQFWRDYVRWRVMENDGFPIKIVTGYKNVDGLKTRLKELGGLFLKTEEVLELPRQTFQQI